MSDVVFVVDDDPIGLAELAGLLRENGGFEVVVVATEAQLATATVGHSPAGIVIATPIWGRDGIAIIESVQRVDPDLAAIVTPRSGDVDAIAAARSRLGPLRVV